MAALAAACAPAHMRTGPAVAAPFDSPSALSLSKGEPFAQHRPAPGHVALAVVTWNMHAGRGDLPRLVSELGAGHLTGQPAADYVLLLQEAVDNGSSDVLTLARARGLSALYAPVRYVDHHFSGNAILATRRLVNARPIVLPQVRQPRGAAAATIEIAGHRLFLVSAHLENRAGWLQGGVLSDRGRGRQADALLQSLPAAEHGVLGGDLNTWLGASEPAWRILARRFTDTPPDPLRPTFWDRLVLDHLFFDLPPDWRATARVIGDTYGSDHHPVVGVITYAPAEPENVFQLDVASEGRKVEN